jgi:hypothetical protein
MTPRSWNRRNERRKVLFGKRVGWQESRINRGRRHGWLNDISRSGVSFLVATIHQPDLGDDVNLYFNANTARQRYQVIRLEPLSGNLTLVGCHKGENQHVAPPDASPTAESPLLARAG